MCSQKNNNVRDAPIHLVNINVVKQHAFCNILFIGSIENAKISIKIHFGGFFKINCGLGLLFLCEIVYLWILLERYSSLCEIE